MWQAMSTTDEKQEEMRKYKTVRSNSGGAGQHPSPLGHPVWSETDPYHASAPSSYQFGPFLTWRPLDLQSITLVLILAGRTVFIL